MKTKIPKRQFDSVKRNFEKFIKDSTQIDISWDSEANCGEGFIQIPNTISLGNRELTNRFPFHLIPIQYVINNFPYLDVFHSYYLPQYSLFIPFVNFK